MVVLPRLTKNLSLVATFFFMVSTSPIRWFQKICMVFMQEWVCSKYY